LGGVYHEIGFGVSLKTLYGGIDRKAPYTNVRKQINP
jgi:hypothetical protein